MEPHKSVLVALVFLAGTSQLAGATGGAQILYPPPDGVADGRTPFQWREGPGAVAYSLSIGTSPGGSDLFDTGETSKLYSLVSRLPRRRRLYAHLGTKGADGSWTYSDSGFQTSLDLFRPARMVFPQDGASGVDAGRAFEWEEDQIVSAYRLQIGTSPGASDLHDSGEVRVTRRFVDELAPGVPLYGRLSASVAGEWHSTVFTFTVSRTGFDASKRIETALWAVDSVRRMADDDNRLNGWTMLAEVAALQDHHRKALCSDYALALYYLLAQANVGMNARIRQMAFGPLDTRALVELNFADDSWMILDPTFDVAARRSSDQGWASAVDISEATLRRTGTRSLMSFLGPEGTRTSEGTISTTRFFT